MHLANVVCMRRQGAELPDGYVKTSLGNAAAPVSHLQDLFGRERARGKKYIHGGHSASANELFPLLLTLIGSMEASNSDTDFSTSLIRRLHRRWLISMSLSHGDGGGRGAGERVQQKSCSFSLAESEQLRKTADLHTLS